MILTKTGTGKFSGPIGKTATLKMVQRSDGTLLRIISAVYGETVLTPASNQVQVPLTTGIKPLTIVYASTLAGGWVDLFEVDAAGAQQKLRAGVFNPSEPSMTISLEGK